MKKSSRHGPRLVVVRYEQLARRGKRRVHDEVIDPGHARYQVEFQTAPADPRRSGRSAAPDAASFDLAVNSPGTDRQKFLPYSIELYSFFHYT